VLIERYALIPDSGGPGKYRGGLGVERTVRMRYDVTFNTQMDRVHCKPWGLQGGGDAMGNAVALELNGKLKEDFANAKVLLAHLKSEEAFVLRSGGGGGFGNPFEREVSRVQEDVRQGYVTAGAARRDYGVAIDPVTFEVDTAETTKLRTPR